MQLEHIITGLMGLYIFSTILVKHKNTQLLAQKQFELGYKAGREGADQSIDNIKIVTMKALEQSATTVSIYADGAKLRDKVILDRDEQISHLKSEIDNLHEELCDTADGMDEDDDDDDDMPNMHSPSASGTMVRRKKQKPDIAYKTKVEGAHSIISDKLHEMYESEKISSDAFFAIKEAVDESLQ